MSKNLMELCLSPDLGGLELYMVRAAKALKGRFEVLSVINSAGKLHSYYEEGNDRFASIRRGSGVMLFSTAKALAHLIDENGIDIIHMHWTKDLPIAVAAKLLSRRKPKLVQTRNMTMTRFKNDFYHRFLYRHMDTILPVTHQVAEQIRTFIPEDVRPEIEVLYMGSDKPELLDDAQVSAMRSDKEMAGQFVVGMVGRINEAKGQHLLIDAIAKIKDETVHAYFVGHEMKKGYTALLQQRAEALGITERVHFLGFMKNPHHFYQMSDAVVLASRRETFGLVLIEAMQVGTAVIGSNSGGVVEIIDDGETGLLFEAGSSESLATCIKCLRDDVRSREAMARSGQEKAERMFSNEAQFKALGDIFKTL